MSASGPREESGVPNAAAALGCQSEAAPASKDDARLGAGPSGGGAPPALIYDDPARLKAERDAADRAYNEALTRLDRAIQRLPADFPHPPPGLDEHQITSLNTLWKIDVPPGGGLRGRLASLVRRIVAPLFAQQQAFNAAVVNHVNCNIPVARETQASIASTLTVLRDTIAELVRFQSVLVMFLQQITPYVDTCDRDVAGLLRGLSGAINAVADELMKRSEALTARDARRELQLGALEQQIADLRARLDELVRALPAARRDHA